MFAENRLLEMSFRIIFFQQKRPALSSLPVGLGILIFFTDHENLEKMEYTSKFEFNEYF